MDRRKKPSVSSSMLPTLLIQRSNLQHSEFRLDGNDPWLKHLEARLEADRWNFTSHVLSMQTALPTSLAPNGWEAPETDADLQLSTYV